MTKLNSIALLLLAIAAISCHRTRLTSISELRASSLDESVLGRRHGSSNSYNGAGAHFSASGPYDTLVLATEWAGSVCSTKKCSQGRPVNNAAFNLHGLWPNVRADYRQSPFDCKSTTVSIPSLPQDLQNALNFYWNPLYNPASSFINHEWQKHGSCWSPVPPSINEVPADLRSLIMSAKDALSQDILHQTSYIRVSIALSQKYNIFNALAASGILPNNSRHLSKNEILSALQSAFGVRNYQIICQKDRSGVSMLYEMRMCLDLNYNPTECSTLQFQCPEEIVYPVYA